MKDLIVNFIGAIVFSIIGFFYVKTRGQGKFAKQFIPTLKEEKAIENELEAEEKQEKEEQKEICKLEKVKLEEKENKKD